MTNATYVDQCEINQPRFSERSTTMKNATYVDQCDTIRTLTDGRSRSPQRGVQNMRKSSLVLAALFSFAVSAEAAPKVVDSKGAVIGTVIGVGTVMVTAPDGNAVAVNAGPAGFLNSFPPLLYVDDPKCSTRPYLIADATPTTGYAILTDENAIFSRSANIVYANTPTVLVGSAQIYAYVYNDSSNSIVCQSVPLPSSVPIGPVGVFSISRPLPFSAVK
jgi:hypothetical protein